MRTKIVGVRPAYVWDASQTTGGPIPEPPAPRLLAGQTPAGLWEGLATQIAEAGFELGLVADATEMFGANELTDYANHVVSVRTAVAGTVFIAIGAFGLSFTALADFAARSGIGTGQAWAWPLIVDGIIVVATVAIVALAGQKAAWYPWALLIGDAVVSVTANALTCAQDSNEARTETIDDGKGSSLVRGVGAGGLSPNTWQRLERLSVAWEKSKSGIGREAPRAAEPDSGVVWNPTRRSRTPLTDMEVDAIRTARANGESVTSICGRFGVHRMTVWTRSKDLP